MKIITGDETGLVKLVDISNRQYFTFKPKSEQQNRALGVCNMTWMDKWNCFCIIRKNSSIEKWSCENNSALQYKNGFNSDIKDPMGVCKLSDSTTDLICYGSGGEFQLIKINQEELTLISKHKSRGQLSTCLPCHGGIAMGGNENDVHLLDSTSDFKMIWSAKNVPHDNLSLRIPVWVTALCFLGDQNSISQAQIVAGTGYKHIRVYDTKAKRQPVSSMNDISEYRITTVLTGTSEHTIYIGDAGGYLHLWDLRTMKRVNTLNGSAGSIRSLQMTESKAMVVSVGLDRFARVYDTKRHKMQSYSYLKNRLNCCLVTGDDSLDASGHSPSKATGKKRGRGGAGDDQSDEGHDYIEDYRDSDEEDNDDSEDDEEEEEVEEDEGDESNSASASSSESDKDDESSDENEADSDSIE